MPRSDRARGIEAKHAAKFLLGKVGRAATAWTAREICPAPGLVISVDQSIGRIGRAWIDPPARGPRRPCPFREPVPGAERAARTLGSPATESRHRRPSALNTNSDRDNPDQPPGGRRGSDEQMFGAK